MKTTIIARALFMLLLCGATAGGAVTFDWATVGNPGNGPDDTGFGAVNYVYRTSQHEVTNAQYTEFLNAVDPAGVNPNLGGPDPFLYRSFMSSNANGGIQLDSSAASGSKYQVKTGRENNPATFVSFFDAMRFTNWLENGQGNGSTETGAYTISDGVSENRHPGARYFIPNENEWYKAAYHKNDGVTANYRDYPTATDVELFSDQPPGSGAPTPSNTANVYSDDRVANGYNDGFAVTGSTVFSSTQNYLTDVGAYATSLSPYGTFDQGGNVMEWNEAVIRPSFRGLRGGHWNNSANFTGATNRDIGIPSIEFDYLGFRVAHIPEPGTGLLGLLGVLSVLWWRRIKR